MNKNQQERRLKLLVRYYELKGLERERWFRSLSLEDRNMLRKEITPAPNKLF